MIRKIKYKIKKILQRERSKDFSLCFFIIIWVISLPLQLPAQSAEKAIYNNTLAGDFSSIPPPATLTSYRNDKKAVAVLHAYTVKAFLDGTQQSCTKAIEASDLLLQASQSTAYTTFFAYTSKSLIQAFTRSYVAATINFISGFHTLQQYLNEQTEIPPEIVVTSKLYNQLIDKIPGRYIFICEFAGITPFNLSEHSKTYATIQGEPAHTLHFFQKIFIEKTRVVKNQPEHTLGLLMNAISALKKRQAERALSILKKIDTTRNQVPLCYYYMGAAYLNTGHYQKANWYFNKFLLLRQNGSMIKSALLRKKWIAIIENKALNHLTKKIETRGTNYTLADNQAIKENKINYNPHLLEARILFDGGLYHKALQKLKRINQHSLSENNFLNYHYRIARIYQAQQNFDKAIAQYRKLSAYPNNGHYYHKKAMLERGKIHIALNNVEKAKNCLQRVESIYSKMYKNSIDREAMVLLEGL